jgi:uridine phosphorylase
VTDDKILPSLKVHPGQLAPQALVVGDPDRAVAAADLLDDAEEVGSYREYRTFTGTFEGAPITIASHGVGGGGASICFDELIQGGVKTLIRAGTCGAMRPGIRDGELIIGTGAIREDGASQYLMPMAYPAVPDRHLVAALAAAAGELGVVAHEGMILTQGYFYNGVLPNGVDTWLEYPVDVAAVEMEYATLLIVASLHGVRAGGIFTSDGNMTEDADPEAYDPHRGVVREGVGTMLNVALTALARLAPGG